MSIKAPLTVELWKNELVCGRINHNCGRKTKLTFHNSSKGKNKKNNVEVRQREASTIALNCGRKQVFPRIKQNYGSKAKLSFHNILKRLIKPNLAKFVPPI